MESIEEICDLEGDLDVLDAVESLVEKSLLRQEEGPEGEPRFVMLETVHEYAREKLQESGEAEAIKRAHAEYFLALAEEAEPELEGPDQLQWMDRLEAEHDNTRAALSRSLGGADAGLGLRLAGALWWFRHVRGHFSKGVRWLEKGLAEKRSGTAGPRVKALLGLGRFEMVQGNLERAVELFEESLTVYRELANDEGTARVLTFLGFAANLQGDYKWQRSLLEEALPLSRRLGDHRNVSLTLNFLALLASDQGDQERAAALWEEGLALAREMGDTWSICATLNNMGWAVLLKGDSGVCDSGLQCG